MAAFSRKQDITIPGSPEEGVAWDWEPHETVTIKGKLTVGDMEVMSNTTMSADSKTPNVSVSTVKMLDLMITRWNLTDDAGNIAEKNERSIAQLDMSYFNPIMEAIDKVSGKKAVADPLPLSTSASEPISVS